MWWRRGQDLTGVSGEGKERGSAEQKTEEIRGCKEGNQSKEREQDSVKWWGLGGVRDHTGGEWRGEREKEHIEEKHREAAKSVYQ